MKKNTNVIETKTTFTGDRPKSVLDRIIAIDQQIGEMMKQAEIYGSNGQIDKSAMCIESAQRLRESKREVEAGHDTTNSALKQQKVLI